jgi:hypothetical protein
MPPLLGKPRKSMTKGRLFLRHVHDCRFATSISEAAVMFVARVSLSTTGLP